MKVSRNENGFTVETLEFRLNLTFQSNDLELWADVVPAHEGSTVRSTDIEKLLGNLSLPGKIDQDGVNQLCAELGRGHGVSNIVVMRGRQAVHGVDGSVRLLGNTGDKIINVRAGEIIAHVIPPTPGIEGMTLTGQPIPAHPGARLAVKVGEGAEWTPDSDPEACRGDVKALVNGRTVYEPWNHSIHVSDKLIIEKGVDNHSGNIEFVGSIEVRGDVSFGMSVKAGGNLKISGNVESANIEAEGDIEISGGISGKEKGRIKCGGNLEARYIDSCLIECNGNIKVKNEIVDSKILCDGMIDVSNGTIVGGKIEALAAIEAKVIGSEIGIATIMVSGRSFTAERKISQLLNEEHHANKQLEQISQRLDPFIKHPDKLIKLSENEKLELRHLSEKFTTLNQRLKELPQEIMRLREDAAKRANPMISAGKYLCKRVELCIDGASTEIAEKYTRPVSVVKNSRNGGLRFINKLKLTDNAAKAERDYANAELQKELTQKSK